VIALENVAARRPPLALADVSLQWGPGVHAIVGANGDGGPLLLALIAGVARPRKGHIRVLDAMATDTAVRQKVAFVPLEPPLPEAMRVTEVLSIASSIRGEPMQSATERLRALGVEALASRWVRTLSHEERRAVAMAEATTSTRVRVLLIDEPFVRLDPRAADRLPGLLRSRSHDGCAVVVATVSVRDAGELADDHVLLRLGAVVGRVPSLDTLAEFSPQGARIRIFASDARVLAAALAREEGVEAVARRDGSVVARGRSAVELARAAGRAILESGVDLIEMRLEPPSLEEARAASAGVAAATYEAALERTRTSLAGASTPSRVSADDFHTTNRQGNP
jgi:ABC-2 type transport system ATP-binding protein